MELRPFPTEATGATETDNALPAGTEGAAEALATEGADEAPSDATEEA